MVVRFCFHSVIRETSHLKALAMAEYRTAQSKKIYSDQSQLLCQQIRKINSFGIFYGENPLEYSFPIMLLQISIVMLITRIVRFLLRPFRQPRIVSEVIGGFVIGPSVLGRSKKFATRMYTENATYLLKNVGLIGFMYFLFMSGVKIDLTTIQKMGRKQWFLALLGVFVPMVIVAAMGIGLRKSLDEELAQASSIMGVSSALAITVVPVIYPIIRELNLLSSEVGRLALSTGLIGDVIGLNLMVAFNAAKQGEYRMTNPLWYLSSLVVVFGLILCMIRLAMERIVRTTPEGIAVKQLYVTAILLGVMVIAFLTDMFGVAIANGPLWLGLLIPDGPPLGSILVEKTEMIVLELLMPFSFAYVGMTMDIFSMSSRWSSLIPLFAMVLAAYITKLVTTLMVSWYFAMPLRDGLTFSLMVSLRGQVEILLFMHWMDLKMIKVPAFTMLVLLATMMTAIATPLISILYDPTKPFLVNRRRTIQHTPPDAELHIEACIHDQESVAGFIHLLEAWRPTLISPFKVYALRLVELGGRTASLFIDHESPDSDSDYTSCNRIHNALRLFKESRGESITIHPFTSVSPKQTMYQDICRLALVSKVSLIILIIHEESLDNRDGSVLGCYEVQSVNSSVLNHAPCSVGVLVYKGHFHNLNCSSQRSPYHFAMLFLGGADAREALAIADRMAGNPDVSLTVVRFLSLESRGENEREKKLDDGLVTWFWVKNEANKRIVYKEVVVRNGVETVAAIQGMHDKFYNLWIVGRKHGINPVLLEGLTDWSEDNELGVIGEYVASLDFSREASVLVVQQQVLSEREKI